jgi:hypothetical protein
MMVLGRARPSRRPLAGRPSAGLDRATGKRRCKSVSGPGECRSCLSKGKCHVEASVRDPMRTRRRKKSRNAAVSLPPVSNYPPCVFDPDILRPRPTLRACGQKQHPSPLCRCGKRSDLRTLVRSPVSGQASQRRRVRLSGDCGAPLEIPCSGLSMRRSRRMEVLAQRPTGEAVSPALGLQCAVREARRGSRLQRDLVALTVLGYN